MSLDLRDETVRWTAACPLGDLVVGRGVAVLLDDSTQVALFALADGRIAAVAHRDPFSGANVIARGLVGNHGLTPTVASPVYKQRFALDTGRCLDEPAVALATFAVAVNDGMVFVGRAG